MDKDIKDTSPDVDELLKDLDDDDDDDFQPESSAGQTNRSLVNILTSSTNLEAIGANQPNWPAAPDWNAASDKNIADETEAAAPALDAEKQEEKVEAAHTVRNMPAIEPPKTVEKPVPEKSLAAPAVTIPSAKPMKLDLSDDVAARPSVDDKLKPGVVVSMPSVSAVSLPDAQSPIGKRPPGPPPKPTLSAAPRVVADNEILLTKDALNDLLPGGKNDDARDLAQLKFVDNNWYASVFNEDYLRTIPKTSPRQTLREAKFIIERLGIQSGARVLDLACGFGRHTIELASKGFDMVGLDLSMVMLKKALADAQARNQAIKFVHGDMRKLAFKAIFDAIYNVQTSFGYFDDYSNFKVMQGIFNALKPGGVFLIETINRDFLVNDLPLRLWWKGVDCMLLEEIDLEHISGLLKVQRSFVFEDNQRPPVEQKIQIRLYSAIEMRAMLMRAGFNVVELSGDYSLPNAYFGATSPRNIFVAEKPVK